MNVQPFRRLTTLASCALVLVAAFAASPVLAEDPPTPEEIIARYVEALGGEETLRAHTSLVLTGSFDMPAMGMSGNLTTHSMAPDKSVSVISLPGMGETVQGYNGEIAWAEDAMQGPRVLDGDALEQVKRDTRFHAPLEYADLYPEQTSAGEAEWDGQAAWQLDLVDTGGNEMSQYFSKETGLLLGVAGTQESEMGAMDMEITFSEYKDFDGQMLPTSTNMSFVSMGMAFTTTTESATFNEVDASIFEPSDTIRSLLPE